MQASCHSCCHSGEAIDHTNFGYTLSLISGKYKLLILYWLSMHKEIMRYSELKKHLGNISHKTLSSTLKEMEADGLIIRTEYPQIPPKVEYCLSEKGESLVPILVAMCDWGKEHKAGNEKNTVIFDLDGTLLNTLTDLAASTNYALQTYGYPTRTIDEVRMFVGNGVRNLIRRALVGGEENPDFEAVFETFKKHYGEHCNDSTCAYPGIMELLHTLQERGIKMAIVSNKADFAVKELAKIYFADLIPVAIGEKEREGIRKKPAPDTVFEALKILGSKAEESLYVGDSDVDILTAANSGMDAVSCTWGFRDLAFLVENGAGYIIDKPEELLQYL